MISAREREPKALRPILVSASTMTTCLGRGLAPARAALQAGASGLTPCAFETVELETCVGEIAGLDEHAIASGLRAFDCRNNRAADLGLMQDGFLDAVEEAVRRHGRERVGVFIGTSTAGILQTEQAYRKREPQSGAL